MKKIVFLSVLISIMASSCKKCVDCSYITKKWNSSTQMMEDFIATEHICKPNYYDDKAWQQTLDAYENNGGSCTR